MEDEQFDERLDELLRQLNDYPGLDWISIRQSFPKLSMNEVVLLMAAAQQQGLIETRNNYWYPTVRV